MKKIIFISLLIASTSLYAMRCGNDIVVEGDSLTSVYSKCGKPHSVESNGIFNSPDSITYNNNDGSTTTVTISNGKVDSIEMNRK